MLGIVRWECFAVLKAKFGGVAAGGDYFRSFDQ